MRTVQIYINDKKLDLFKDEKISINSSVQNISDISKVLTDYSGSFTIPCSNNNNAIFDYFYNNDVDGDFKAKKRAPARIEIDNIPFRKGKIQLEGSEVKNNNADYYKITFFGDMVSLKDLFGEDTLSSLDYSNLTTNYTGSYIKDSITNTNHLDVRYPLISSNRVWQYGNGGSTDISTVGGVIDYKELFPAICDKAIMDLIQSKYGLTFEGTFLESDYFKKSFTWWKNSEAPIFRSSPIDLEFNDTTPNSTLIDNNVYLNYIDLTDVTLGFQNHFIKAYIQTTSSTDWFLDVYRNGEHIQTITGSGNAYKSIALTQNNPSLSDTYNFKIRTTGVASTINGSIRTGIAYYVPAGGGNTNTETIEYTTDFNSVNTTTDTDFNNTAPNIKISDWFSGILKQFNLTCYPLEDENTFEVEPLQQWYNFGGELDITPYTDVKSIKVNRPKLHKAISFEYEKSKAFLNTAFEGNFSRHYGNLKEKFDYDGKDLKIKLPFENMLFNRFDNTNLQVSYSLDKAIDGKSIIPKPVKLFLNDSKDCSFYFGTESSDDLITSYMPFGQDMTFNLELHSQNFGFDLSTMTNRVTENSLYADFYEAYLQNLYNNKTRKVSLKCVLPLSKLTMLTLDDTIILRDKKYLINNMSVDLTSGEVSLTLLSSWVTKEGAINSPITELPSIGGELSLVAKPKKPLIPNKKFDGGGGTVTIGQTRETQWIGGVYPQTYDSETEFTFSIPANNTGASRIQTIQVVYRDTQGGLIKQENIVITQESNNGYLLTESNGYLLTEDINRILI